MVDGEDIDALALVGGLLAEAAVGRVPASDGCSTADVGESRDVALLLPAGVLGHETVGTVGARDSSEGAVGIIVASVVGDYYLYVSGIGGVDALYVVLTRDGRDGGGEGEDGEDVGQLHVCGLGW